MSSGPKYFIKNSTVPAKPRKNAPGCRLDPFFAEKMRILAESPSAPQPHSRPAVVRWLAQGAFGVSLFSGANLTAAEIPAVELPGETPAVATKSSSILPEYPDLTLGLATGLASEASAPDSNPPATPPAPEPRAGFSEPSAETPAVGLTPSSPPVPAESGIIPVPSAVEAAAAETAAPSAAGEPATANPSAAEPVGSSSPEDSANQGNPANQEAAKSWNVSLFTGVTYDDNIRFAAGSENQLSDVIWNTGISTGYNLPGSGLLRSLSFSAGGSYQSYLDNEELSGWNYNASLSAARNVGDLTLSGSVFAAQMNSADRWAGNFATRQSYGASLSAAYSLTGKIRLVANGNWNAFDYDEQLLGTQSWNLSTGFDYQFSPKLRGGINYGWSTLEQDGYDNRSWSSINFTAAWQASPKTGLSASVGPQIGNFNGSINDGPGWVASLSGNWQATEHTLIVLGLNRNATGSPVNGGSSINFTTVSLSVSQRITDRLSGSAVIAYQKDDFNADQQDAFGGRQDDFLSLTTSLSWRFTTRASLTAFYEFRNNTSNSQGSDFSNNRVGCQLSVQF